MLNFVSACVNIQENPYSASLDTSILNIEERIVGDFECPPYIADAFDFDIPVKDVGPEWDRGPMWDLCDTLRFRRIKAGELELTALNDFETIDTKILIAGEDYTNRDGWLVFPMVEGGFYSEGLAIAGGGLIGTLAFTVNMSGDLIVKNSGTLAGLLVFIPIMGYMTDWDIIKRKDKQEERKDKQGELQFIFDGRVPQPPEPVRPPPVEW